MPKFSIVVPARNRAYTLVHTLRTCVGQKEFDDYEVIVSDNCSTDNTEEVVKSLNSEKIKYFKTDKPLAMADSWNFAIEKANGEYVMFVGSDDAVNIYGLYALDKIISLTNEKMIRWIPSVYYWPDYIISYKKNCMHLYDKNTIEIISTKKSIQDVLNYTKPLGYIPYIYAVGVSHRDLISRLYERTGKVFDTIDPDTYFGFALSALIQKYLCINIPVCIMGRAGTSNAAQNLYRYMQNPGTENIKQSDKKNNLPTNGLFSREGIASINDSVIFNAYACAKKNMNAFDNVKINYTKHIRAVINECYAKYNFLGNEGRGLFIKELKIIREVIEKNDDLKAAFDGYGLDIDNYVFYDGDSAIAPYITGDIFWVDTNKFDVQNIYDAALLTQKLLYDKKSIDVRLSKLEDNWNGYKKLFAKLGKCKRVGIFATGKHTAALLENYQGYDCNKDKFILFDNDSTKWGTDFMGYKVMPPQSIPELKPDVLIISSYIYQNEIYESIKQYSNDTEIIKLYGNNNEWFKFPITGFC